MSNLRPGHTRWLFAFYAMDFIEGRTLEEIIIKNGPLSVGATLEVFIKVAEGLSYAHRRSIVLRYQASQYHGGEAR
ncbi:MAG: hypothetical protein IPP57_10800 [Candidatus Obscuribacter sp.]|nr:hypothetical protein [Candidatus Obscuribacter sp.]